MRSVSRKYSFWLAGYYDDFNSARVLPDDSNVVGTTYKSSASHHGNPINGYAPLNPRYTYAWVERGDADGGRFSGASVVAAASNGPQYLHNSGMHEWLTYDENRRGASDWSGRASPQYPNSISNANRQKFAKGTGNGTGNAYKSTDTVEGYMLFCNGYDTSGKYWVPTGETDSTFGRDTMQKMDGVVATSGVPNTSAAIPAAHQQYAHLTGVLMGERTAPTATDAGNGWANSLLYPVKSPSGKPFMLINSWHDTSIANTFKPMIIYDGSLNSLGTSDIFHARVNLQGLIENGNYVGADSWKAEIKIGFTGSPTQTGFANNSAITHVIESDGTGLNAAPAAGAFLEWVGSSGSTATQNTYTESQLWIDLDISIDYDAYTYDVFVNGVAVSTNTAMTAKSGGGNFTPSEMYGWQINMARLVSGGGYDWKGILCVDRAAIYRPIQDNPDSAIEDLNILDVNLNQTVNSSSSLAITVADDTNSMGSNIKDIIQGSSFSFWNLLMFTQNINRPIWRGIINSINYTQDAKMNAMLLKINASDYLTLLDQEIPNWQVGQAGDADSGETINFKRGEAQNKIDAYYFGANRLEDANATLGFNYVEDGAYLPHTDSRMRLNSAHPIQMYNNEDTAGPNSVEDDWVSQNVGPAFTTNAASATADVIFYDPNDTAQAGGLDQFTLASANIIPAGNYDWASQGTAVYGTDAAKNIFTVEDEGDHLVTIPLITAQFGTWIPSGGVTLGSLVAAKTINKIEAYSGAGNYVSILNAYGFVTEVTFSAAHNYVDFQNIQIGSSNSVPTIVGDWQIEVISPTKILIFPQNQTTTAGDSGATVASDLVRVSDVTELPPAGQMTTGSTVFNYTSLAQGSLPGQVSGVLRGCAIVSGGDILQGVPVTLNSNYLSTKGATSSLSSVAKGDVVGISTGTSDLASGLYTVKRTPTTDGANTLLYLGVAHPGGTPNRSTELVSIATGLSVPKGESNPIFRSIHGRWIRDIAASRWFKFQFGSIKKDSLGSALLTEDITPASTTIRVGSVFPAAANTGIDAGVLGSGDFTYEIIDSNGFVDAGMADKVSNFDSSTLLSWDYSNSNFHPTSSPTGPTAADPTRELRYLVRFNIAWTAALAAQLIENRQVVLALSRDIADTNYDGKYILKDVSNGGSGGFIRGTLMREDGSYPYTVYPDAGTPKPYIGGYFLFLHSTRNTGSVSIAATTLPLTSASDFSASGGSGIINGTDVFQWTGKSTNTLTGVTGITSTHAASELVEDALEMKIGVGSNPLTKSFLARNHSAGETLNVREVSTDFKHIWVLWADMRNTGSADADGSDRKSEYGLLYPTSKNYSVKLVFADQDVTGYDERDSFCELKVGSEINMWSMDSMVEPGTGGLWSALGSNSETNSVYHNWENKAGSFVILDTSPFFNMNTESNGGKTGQISGGQKEVGDFIVETEGFPVIIDNYWARAPATFLNSGGNFVTNHVNQFNFISDPSAVTKDVDIGDDYIQIFDASNFPASGEGQIVSHKTDKTWFFGWSAKGYTATIGGVASIANSTTSAAGLITSVITCSAGFAPALDVGKQITLSGTNSVPAINDTFTIVAVGLNTYTIALPVAVTTPGTAGTITNANVLYVGTNSVFYENRVTDGGNWNGLAYTTPAGYGGLSASELITAKGNQGGSLVDLPVQEGSDGRMDDLTAYNTLASVFPMRLMMEVSGFNESRNSGSWYENDKVRVTWMDALTETWLKQVVLNGMYDINNIPLMRKHTTIASGADTAGYGALISSYAQASGNIVITVPASHGFVAGDLITVDGTNFDGDYTITAVASTTITVVGTAGSTSTGFLWNRLLFDEWGSVNDCRNQSLAGVLSSSAAAAGIGADNGSVATMNYLIGKDARIEYRPTYSSGFTFDRDNLKVSNMSGDVSSQISNVRVMYAAGSSFVDYPSATLGTRARWKTIQMPDIFNRSEALIVAKQEYNKNKKGPLSISAEILRLDDNNTFDGLKDLMIDQARHGYIADATRMGLGVVAGGVWSDPNDGMVFPGIVNALDGRAGAAKDEGTGATRTWDEFYYWHGANSVSHAVQIVSVPRGMPTSSQASPSTGYVVDKLRVVITVDDTLPATTQPENARFRIHLVDYEFKTNDKGTNADGTHHTPGYFAAVKSSSTLTVQGNGFYEMPIPSSYWSPLPEGSVLVISVNYDYLQSLLTYRCGSLTDAAFFNNAHATLGSLTASPYNTSSIFPLGIREYTEMGPIATDGGAGRSEWYAPRLHITDDFQFAPATTVSYTDNYLGLEEEPMVIKSINYSAGHNKIEKVSLKLERDASRAAKSFSSWIVAGNSRTGTPSWSPGGGMTDRQKARFKDRYGADDSKGSSGGPAPLGIFGGGGSVDALPNDKFTDEIVPLDRPSPLGINSPGIESEKASAISASSLNKGTMGRVKGAMDIGSDGITGGSFSILGQNKAGAPPKNTAGIEVISSSPSAGWASSSEGGINFPGTVGETINYPFHEYTIMARVPNTVEQNYVVVTGQVTMGAAEAARIKVSVDCAENTVAAKTVTNVIAANTSNETQTLFAGFVQGADINNNTVRVKLSRTPGDGTDAGTSASVLIRSVQISMSQKSVNGNEKSGEMTFKS